MVSLMKEPSGTLNGLRRATEPAIIKVTKTPALINSVNIIISPFPSRATSDVKMSGAPFPNANIVTPAMLSDRCMMLAITASAGQKLEQKGHSEVIHSDARRVILRASKRQYADTEGDPDFRAFGFPVAVIGRAPSRHLIFVKRERTGKRPFVIFEGTAPWTLETRADMNLSVIGLVSCQKSKSVAATV